MKTKKILIFVFILFTLILVGCDKDNNNNFVLDGEYKGSCIYTSFVLSSYVDSTELEIKDNKLIIDKEYELTSFALTKSFFDDDYNIGLSSDIMNAFSYPSTQLCSVEESSQEVVAKKAILIDKDNQVYYVEYAQSSEYNAIHRIFLLEKVKETNSD